MLCRAFLTATLGTIVLGLAQAQPGTNDPSFNPGDVGNGYGDGPSNNVNTQLVLPNGKVIIGGYFSFVHGFVRNSIARLNIDGTLDLSFDPGPGFNDAVWAVAVQADGKLIVGGEFTTCAGVARNRIARLNSDGSFDASFNPGTGFNLGVQALAVQADGKVLVGGAFYTFNGVAGTKLVRLLADGTRDAAFNAGNIPGSGSIAVRALALATSGQLYAGGDFSSVAGNSRPGFAKFNADGSLVPGFPAAGVNNLNAHSINIQPDGKLLLGVFASAKRLNTDGTLDASFVTYTVTGGPLTPGVDQVLLQTDGKALVYGDFTTYNGTLVFRRGMARLNVNGSLDPSFQPISTGRMLLLPDGDILMRGSLRLNPDGSEDPAYYPGSGFNGTVQCIVPQPDGRILLGGAFSSFYDQPSFGIVRLEPDGERDPGFQSPTQLPYGYSHEVEDIVLQPDGKVLVARLGLDRLNPDGSLDPSFDDGLGGNSNSGGYRTLAMLPDGKILLGGDFTEYNGQMVRGLVRLHPNGALDESFDASGVLANGLVVDLAVQTDGRILIAGTGSVVRLNADGSLDPSFEGPDMLSDPFTQPVNVVELQPDGRVLIGGAFYNCDGQPRQGIARLHPDGSLDFSFNTSGADIYQPWAITLQSDGRIVIAGANSYYAAPRKTIARLNTDGSLDASFNVGTGFSYYGSAYCRVEALALQADGQVMAGGNFTNYAGSGRNRIARLNGGAASHVDLAARVVLDGPYNTITGLMNDGLRANGLLLADEPYSSVGYEYTGTGASTMNAGVASLAGNNAIVDWVLMELRDRDDATHVLASRAALVQRDGDVVDVDGHSAVRFDAPPDNYYVSVRHRNHLGVMTTGTYALGPQVIALDLTHPATPTYGTGARKAVGNTMTLWSGDINFNSEVKYTGSGNDRDLILTAVGSFVPNNTITGYRQEDVNLDGVVKYTGAGNDRDPVLLTVGGTVPTNVRAAQLP